MTIIDGESGVVLGTVDAARADATVFPGAVYLHQGFPYRVESLADDVAVVRPDRDGLRTFARQETSVEILSTEDEADLGIGTWAQGGVLVSSRVVGYDIRRADDGVYLGYKPLAMPVRRLHTHGTWCKKAPETRVMVVPGSARVRLQAEAEGLDRVFLDFGAEWRNAGCSMCLGMNPDRLSPGERCASTSNRNFQGRQGPGGRTHLVSPLVAAATAVKGKLATPSDLG